MALSPITRVPRPVVSALVLIAASAGVVAGYVTLMRYSTTPGAGPDAPRRMPVELEQALAPCEGASLYARPVLVLCMHPQCPCTTATVEQLETIARRAGNALT